MQISFLDDVESDRVKNITGLDCEFKMKIDRRYPGMQPVFCCESNTINKGQGICLLQVNDRYALPVFNHYGANNTCTQCTWYVNISYLSIIQHFTYCLISHYNDEKKAFEPNDKYCNTFDLLLGYVFYANANATEANMLLANLILNRSYVNTTSLAYNISYAATSYGYTDESFVDAEWRNKAYEFCTFDGHSCSLVIYDSFDYNYSYVNEFYYQVPYGACNNTFISKTWFFVIFIILC